VHFGGLVAGFGVPDVLNLVDIPFVASGATATTATWMQLATGASASGSLMVAQATHSATVMLLGTYMTTNFHLQGNGAGGTVVTDPPAAPVAITDTGPFLLVAAHRA
jgi:hypothetical protein